MKLILTDEVEWVSPGVLLFSKERLAEILEFINDGERLDRDAELHNEAETGEQTCPSCDGTGWFRSKVDNWRGTCRHCNGTGHV